ncbi:MAG: phosphoserine phosphatase SerB [Roseitalea sp.]|jgi:phosphoserine phosphatase|nr:phosphoserine phosphatase SerB [Roseitalea sp.]MBO6722519.1 phosphoserine phosphatase SerB [Roseitalea sp.]MBO6742293.1 phosphoserine phosphatase SerB [Roseitalea sp.]
MSHIITLIANPATRALDPTLAEAAAHAVGARSMTWLGERLAADLAVEGADGHAAALADVIGDAPIDHVVQKDEGSDARRKAILLADMDSTMIRQECIDELAAEAGIKDKVAAITARAMNGEIEFEGALRERVALLEGLPLDVIDKVIAERIELMPGGRELVRTMAANGAHCALVSGGFTDFTARIADLIGFHEHRANRLVHEDGKLTGEVAAPILGKQAKADALIKIAGRLGVGTDRAIAVGDGANDLAMLDMAGTGIALHAKPAVAERAGMRIDHGDLTALLFIQGYREDEIVR